MMKILQITVLVFNIILLSAINSAIAQETAELGSVSEGLKDDAFPCALGGGCDEDIISADPTFIQMSPDEHQVVMTQTSTSIQAHGLVGEILIPYDGALVRANVPIFGRAYGKNFQEYRIEYGQGDNPTDWTILETSETPQTHNVFPDNLYLSADLSIEGNLSTWDTGLKNYVYLPTHPKDHPVNFKGTYTVRLVVTSLEGQSVEDRVTLHVANVIPNALGGMILSPDKQVSLLVPEQSITAPFRLILIQTAAQVPVTSEQGRTLVGHVYEVKEASEKFTKNVVLEMKVPESATFDNEIESMAIYGYDSTKQEWTILPSFHRVDRQSLFTNVTYLHAFYAVMSSKLMSEGSNLAPSESSESNLHRVKASPKSTHYLIQDTFEDGVGHWSNRDGEVGAAVSVDELSTFDGTKALKIVNTKAGGNFGVNIISSPFDVRDYPVVQFDYRMEPDVKTSFYVKVAGRWYRIGLTDDYTEFRNKRVNIADIGVVPDILSDDAWHNAQFNLYDMLQTKTGHTVVEEMIMADWDVTGYMKLQFGTNREGARYYIDNFAISRELYAGLRTDEDVILVDNFNQKKQRNNFGQQAYTFYESDEKIVQIAFNTEDASGLGHALSISYDVSKSETHGGGYVTLLPDLDLRGYHALSFSVKSIEADQDLLVGLRDNKGNERKVSLSVYLPEKIDTDWKRVIIPLTAFSSPMYWGAITNLSLSFQHDLHSKGMILVDNIEFHKHIRSLHVDSFEQWNGRNLLGGHHWTFANGAAAVNGTYTRGSPNGLYRLCLGGNIGEVKAYASELLTYAGWTTFLGGIDCTRCPGVTFRVRGAQGGERPNIYLDDGNFRWGVDLEDYLHVTTDWQSVTIPLNDFADYGVDLTHLEEFQVVFEWEEMSGTVYLDDVQLGEMTQSSP